MKQEPTHGAYIGRFNPIHKGHQVVIDKMIEKYGYKNSLVIIGSSNSTQSLKHFFSYTERRQFLITLYPEIKIIGMPDYPGDDIAWGLALHDIISSTSSSFFTDVEFFGGCHEDVCWLKDYNYENINILNRFDGTTPKISATEIRDTLIYNKSLDGMIDKQIQELVRIRFKNKWEEFKKQ